MKILIAVPCMDMCACGFAQSLAMLRKIGDVSVAFKVGSLIYESRNNLAKEAIKFEADYILWLDSDMIFAPDTLERLFEHMKDKDIVSGLYFRRVAPFSPVLFKWLNPNSKLNSWQGYDDYPIDSVFEVQGIGFGCVLMKADVLYDMGAKYGDFFAPINGFGEDLSFCVRARELGYKIYCDSSIKLGHVGHQTVSEELYQVYRKELKNNGR